jgi:hypothetical protein
MTARVTPFVRTVGLLMMAALAPRRADFLRRMCAATDTAQSVVSDPAALRSASARKMGPKLRHR